MEQVAERQSHFGIRKLTIGAASVLLGTTLWMSNGNVVQASDNENGNNANGDQTANKSETETPKVRDNTQVVVQVNGDSAEQNKTAQESITKDETSVKDAEVQAPQSKMGGAVETPTQSSKTTTSRTQANNQVANSSQKSAQSNETSLHAQNPVNNEQTETNNKVTINATEKIADAGKLGKAKLEKANTVDKLEKTDIAAKTINKKSKTNIPKTTTLDIPASSNAAGLSSDNTKMSEEQIKRLLRASFATASSTSTENKDSVNINNIEAKGTINTDTIPQNVKDIVNDTSKIPFVELSNGVWNETQKQYLGDTQHIVLATDKSNPGEKIYFYVSNNVGTTYNTVLAKTLDTKAGKPSIVNINNSEHPGINGQYTIYSNSATTNGVTYNAAYIDGKNVDKHSSGSYAAPSLHRRWTLGLNGKNDAGTWVASSTNTPEKVNQHIYYVNADTGKVLGSKIVNYGKDGIFGGESYTIDSNAVPNKLTVDGRTYNYVESYNDINKNKIKDFNNIEIIDPSTNYDAGKIGDFLEKVETKVVSPDPFQTKQTTTNIEKAPLTGIINPVF